MSIFVVVVSIGAHGSKAATGADNPDACPAPAAVVDDFTGPAGAPPNPQLWNYELGAGGTDGQFEAYTNSPRNASLNGNGNLAIVALNEPFYYPGYGTANYTSASLNTHGRLDFCYGDVAARIKMPSGRGLRPAFWLVGSDLSTVGWPQSGEIDIVESANGGASTIHGAGGYELPVSVPFNIGTEFHEYALHWRRDRITVSMDGHDYASWTPASLPPGSTWTFNNHPMYMILNIAVGGPGFPPDHSTPFPATMLVDWVRYTPA
ncbi:MAG: glycoside hydrolase family 16 protein [Mycobacterium sp.]